MTNEEKILAKLDELTGEIQEAKKAIRPYVELKQEIEPLIHDMVINTIHKLGGLDRRFNLEDLGDMLGQLLVSSRNITDALQTLNSVIEFKKDFEPYSREIFQELVSSLETSLHGFNPKDLQDLFKQFIANMGSLAEGLKMVGSMMDMKSDAGTLSKLAFNDAVERLENLKQRGVFDSFEKVLWATEQIGNKMQQVTFDDVKPVRGIFGMLSAMKRPEVQEGLGVLIELSTVAAALKENKEIA